MNILGISCFYHDAAAALIKDGVLIAAAEEERFSRKKHDSDFPIRAVDFCLRKGKIQKDQIDYVVFYEKPFLKFERLMLSIMVGYPKSSSVFRESMKVWLSQKLWVKSIISQELKLPASKILFSDHHVSHAASSFFCSPFEEAAILTVDGVGEWTTTSIGTATALWNGKGKNEIKLESDICFPHSIGMLYSAFTAYLGFEVNEGEYKVMGMAPYGEPKYMDKIYKLIHVNEDGSFALDMSYFSYYYHHQNTYTDKFVELMGKPSRNPDARFVTSQTSLYDDPVPPAAEEMELNQYYADIAASIQKVTEEILVKIAKNLHQKTKMKKLCMAGGVALNSVANYRILKESGFDEVYIQPAAGDSGGAIGAALFLYHVIIGQPRQFVMEHAYWGEEYGENVIADFVAKNNIRHEVIQDDEKLFDRVIDLLKEGKVIGWYQGAFEWGPRALGNRSILADARNPKMKDIVNIKIKFREPFRPFAPSVIQEECEKYFELPDSMKHYPAKFMLYVTPVKENQKKNLPAITHADGTGRLQTVSKETNPRYHRLIQKFGEATGTPIVLNTSFNLRGEPIVTTPENAFNTYSKSGMDALILKNTLIQKST